MYHVYTWSGRWLAFFYLEGIIDPLQSRFATVLFPRILSQNGVKFIYGYNYHSFEQISF